MEKSGRIKDMTDDAHSQFVDGLRVTAEHLQHLQDRLRESVVDLRRTVGLGRIAWGLRAALDNGAVTLTPGCAFSLNGIRLFVDASLNLGTPPLPARLVLRASNADKPALRVAGTPTVITQLTTAQMETDDGSPVDDSALVIATIKDVDGTATLAQDEKLFVAAGDHSHSGTHFQDEQGRWHFDGTLISGAKGDKGDSGPAGPQGEKGDKGDKGDSGPAGPQGEKGDKGDQGIAGPKGDKGDQGVPGPQGPTGPPGPTAQLDWPFITRVSWRQGAQFSLSEAQQMLSRLRINLSSPLNPALLETNQPQVIQVWFEPDSPPAATVNIRSPQQILVLHGTQKLAFQEIDWGINDSADAVGKVLRQGGRLLIRVHVTHLFDVDKRPFCPALEALTGVNYPHVPGGVWESWVFVVAG